jgi:hypothetical protein
MIKIKSIKNMIGVDLALFKQRFYYCFNLLDTSYLPTPLQYAILETQREEASWAKYLDHTTVCVFNSTRERDIARISLIIWEESFMRWNKIPLN